MSKKVIISGFCVVVILVGGIGFREWKNNTIKDQRITETQKEENKNNQPVTFEDLFNNLALMKATTPDVSDWVGYRNDAMGFSIKIPNDWYVESSNGKFVCIKSKTRKFYFEGGESCGIVVNKYSEDDFVRFIEMSKKDNELKYIELDSKKILYMSGYSLPRVAIKNKDDVWEASIQGADNSIKNETLYGIINFIRFE